MSWSTHRPDPRVPRFSAALGVVWAAILGLMAVSPVFAEADIEEVLSRAPKAPAANELRPLRILLLADEKDHGPGEHDYPLWQTRWHRLLADNSAIAPKISVATARRWPSAEQLARADLLVMYCYPGSPKERVFQPQQIDQLAEFLAGGGGFVPIHSATYTVADLTTAEGRKLLACTGLSFAKTIQYRHGPVTMEVVNSDHPICVGLPSVLHFVDEPYWPPSGALSQVCVLAATNERVSQDVGKNERQPLFWTHEYGKGRVFGCVLGHYSTTFDDPYFRILLLRGMAWAAGESPYRFDSLVLAKAAPDPLGQEAISSSAK